MKPNQAIACALAALFASLTCAEGPGGEVTGPGRPAVGPAAPAFPMVEPAAEEIEVPPPPFSEGVFPCSDCHDPEIPVNTRRRTLRTAHQEIVLHHDEEHRWCLDCHAEKDRDKLHLASGELVDFTASYELCGQCHGDKLRDWKAGIHGRRSGRWDGHKTYLLCVHCHNSHSPKFLPLEPLPPPARPGARQP